MSFQELPSLQKADDGEWTSSGKLTLSCLSHISDMLKTGGGKKKYKEKEQEREKYYS